MKIKALSSIVLFGALLLSVAPVEARTSVSVGFNGGCAYPGTCQGPYQGYVVDQYYPYYAEPVYVRPAPRGPVYCAPRPYYEPVYVAPQPVYVAPQPVYCAPRRRVCLQGFSFGFNFGR